ncbi:hypothetical protein CON36_30580 [Bacillus cereus]|uniref:Peptidase n=3 Tax=Bacillus TaxID=1386 RepID=A0A9X6ZUR4_BACTU|nr:hypothetical protein CON36_30580 [Bacillus cereus]PFJ42787.1 hypothetical protein COJ15_05445 [Bacillus thuringiensis]PGP21098.1 hypothetical protein COA01_16295 [Bacillus cereus]
MIAYEYRKGGEQMIPYTILGLVAASILINFIVYKKLTKISKEIKPSSISGEDMAQRILGENQIHDIKIEKTDKVGDNYFHPIHKRIQLGPEVYGMKTIYSLTIGSHEACHAVDYNYFRFLNLKISKFKNFVFLPAFVLSFFVDVSWFQSCVLWSYVALVAFYFFVEVCDELATNRRAYRALEQFKGLSKDELREVKKVQRVMNLTYLTSIPSSIVR